MCPRTVPAEAGLDEVLFELRRVGNSVRVAAIDPKTGTEVTVCAAPGASERALQTVAMRKLAWALARHSRRELVGFFP